MEEIKEIRTGKYSHDRAGLLVVLIKELERKASLTRINGQGDVNNRTCIHGSRVDESHQEMKNKVIQRESITVIGGVMRKMIAVSKNMQGRGN